MLNHELMRRQFQIVHKIRNRNHRKKLNQQMNVIGHSTNRIHHPFLVPDESPYISIQPVLLLQVYGRCPIPRGKHNVIIQLRIAHIIISFFISCQFINTINKKQSRERIHHTKRERTAKSERERTTKYGRERMTKYGRERMTKYERERHPRGFRRCKHPRLSRSSTASGRQSMRKTFIKRKTPWVLAPTETERMNNERTENERPNNGRKTNLPFITNHTFITDQNHPMFPSYPRTNTFTTYSDKKQATHSPFLQAKTLPNIL